MFEVPTINNHLSKTQIKIMAEHTIDNLLDNGKLIDSIDALSKMEYFIKEIKANKEYINALRDEISKYGKDINTITGTKVELAEVGIKYDYSKCNDSVLISLQNELDLLSEKIKERQDFLKKIPIAGIDIIDENGETFKIYPPSRSSTSSVKTTIAR